MTSVSTPKIIASTLAELGVTHCFTVVGSGNFHLTNFLAARGITVVQARHEAGAMTMADAHARMTGIPAVVTVHQGCGLTNTVTGLGEAAKSRTPVLVLSAQAGRGDVFSNFAVDQAALARAVGAEAVDITSAVAARAQITRAFRTALADRRTVLVNLPLDVQAQHADDAPVTASTPVAIPSPRASQDEMQRFVELLSQSKRPVFIAGRGARAARNELVALADGVGALLATSAVAKGLFNGHPFDLGISGGFSSPTTARLIADADLVVGFGCALNQWTTRHGKLLNPDVRLVQVDVDSTAIGNHRPVTLPVLGDSAAVARDALELLRTQAAEPRYRTSDVARQIAQGDWRHESYQDLSTAQRIDPRTLTKELDRILPVERIVAVDSGNFMGYPSQFLSVPDEEGFCFTQAFQSIGLGLATAIGAALARPDRLPVLGTGDGGFHMAIAELETAVRLKLPLVCIVYHDAAYGAEVHHFTGEDENREFVEFPDTDVAAIARGFGCEALTVRTVEDLEPVRNWVDSNPQRPLVIDAKIASDGGAWWLQEAFANH